MASVDRFLNKRYDAGSYNCAHLVAEAWKAETGVDIAHKLRGFLLPPADRRVIRSDCRQFARLPAPVSPCIVLMHQRGRAPHVGIYLRGKVLHIRRAGVQFQPLDVVSIGFYKVGFYVC